MQFRLKTSHQTAEILKYLQSCTGLTPNVLARLAISLSLLDQEPVANFITNANGIEFNRHTLTGQYDVVFKCLIAKHENRPITDNEYFPDLIKLHLDRGSAKLQNEYKYAGNYEKFIINLAHNSAEVQI